MQKTVLLEVKHNKPFYPANQNAEVYIKETLLVNLRKLPEFELMSIKFCKHTLKAFAKLDLINVEEDRVSPIQNKVNKLGKNICKKFKTTFNPIEIT